MNVENIIIEGTSDIPSISFLFSDGLFSMKGRSLPPNPYEFYKPIMAPLEQYLADWKGDICFDIQMWYFNTASSKQILDLLNMFIPGKKDAEEGRILSYKSLVINWCYSKDDEDMFDAGKDYADLLDIKSHPSISFRLVEK